MIRFCRALALLPPRVAVVGGGGGVGGTSVGESSDEAAVSFMGEMTRSK